MSRFLFHCQQFNGSSKGRWQSGTKKSYIQRNTKVWALFPGKNLPQIHEKICKFSYFVSSDWHVPYDSFNRLRIEMWGTWWQSLAGEESCVVLQLQPSTFPKTLPFQWFFFVKNLYFKKSFWFWLMRLISATFPPKNCPRSFCWLLLQVWERPRGEDQSEEVGRSWWSRHQDSPTNLSISLSCLFECSVPTNDFQSSLPRSSCWQF